MAEPVLIVLLAIERTDVHLGDTAVAIGEDIIGLMVNQALKVAVFSKVFALNIDSGRLKIAWRLGASATATPKRCNPDGKHGHTSRAQGGGHVTLLGNLSPGIPYPLQ